VATSPAAKTVHQLMITIDDIEPAPWRRVLVPSGVTLLRLHKVIQELFDWWDYHLHEFEIDGVRYGSDDGDDWEPPLDERKAKLDKLAPKGNRFLYRYDFGDNWQFPIEVEDVLPADPRATYPRCIDGRRSRPPEDVGGTGGYEEFLEAIADPDHEEYESMLVWAGGSFDPEACDLLDINARLTAIRR